MFTGLRPVPVTGGVLIDCPGTGQDGELQKGVRVSPRFTDEADGTVKDELTGLIWLKDAGCVAPAPWADALTAANGLANGACGLTDGSVAGDWRLPNIQELRSLVDINRSDPALPPGHPFSGVQSAYYWSSTTVASAWYSAWSALFQIGTFSPNIPKSHSQPVWPVRNGPPADSQRCAGPPWAMAATGQDGEYQMGASVSPRFTDRGDGTVSDNLTGPTWLKTANCFGGRTWSDALAVSQSLAGGSCGLTDGSAPGAWRLPNIKELESLLDFSQYFPALPPDHPFSDVQGNLCPYWSSTTIVRYPDSAWLLFLSDGFLSGSRNYVREHCVWPVRGGQ